jgi:hypothetical protein
MTAVAHNTAPLEGLQHPARPSWLTDAPVEIDSHVSMLDPSAIGLRANSGEVTVPAILELPGVNGELEPVAIVRHELPGGETQIALHGLVRNHRGALKVANRRGVNLAVPTEEEGTRHVEIGNANGDITRAQLFGVRGLKRGARRFSDAIGDQAVDLIVTAQGNVMASATTEEQRVARMTAQRLIPARKATGRHYVSVEDPMHIDYVSPEEQARRREEAEKIRLAQVAERERLEAEHRAAVFAPRQVPDLTAGDQPPANYEGLRVTPESRAFAREWVGRALRHDSTYREIVEQALGDRLDARNAAAVDRAIDLVRSDAAVRLRLGESYQWRIERQLDMMDPGSGNIGQKTFKNPNSVGYEAIRMYGPEYAAVLALSHLDGTFDPSRESRLATEADLNVYGWPKIDQHRSAARYAIDGMSFKERAKSSS